MERELGKKCLFDACSNHPKWSSLEHDQQTLIIRRIERDCYNKTVKDCTDLGVQKIWSEKKFYSKYSAECYKICSNLDPTSSVGSPYLLDAILEGKISTLEITELTSYDLCPEASQDERKLIDSRRKIKVDIKVSKSYKCSKCGNQETTVREYQGNAADEASKHSIKCLGCGHTWRK